MSKIYVDEIHPKTAGGGVSLADAGSGIFYREGTWTPVLGATSSDPTVTYQNQRGRYVRIGNAVFIFMAIEVNSGGISGGSGDGVIKGLPFSIHTDTNMTYGLGSWKWSFLEYNGSFSAGRDNIDLLPLKTTNEFRVLQVNHGNPDENIWTGVAISQIDDGYLRWEGSGMYLTDEA